MRIELIPRQYAGLDDEAKSLHRCPEDAQSRCVVHL